MRLKNISLIFPEDKIWVKHFLELFEDISIQKGNTTYFHTMPSNALPEISVVTESVESPTLFLDTTIDKNITIGNFSIGTNKEKLTSRSISNNGELHNSNKITIEVLRIKLKGNLTGVDHFGLNIPEHLLSLEEWYSLKQYLAKVTNLYNYPDEEWPFIIPSTDQEFNDDITDFSSLRAPKFEWVYDSYTKVPYLQFALYTNLTRNQCESMFPEPIAFSIPGLEEIFRSIFIRSPWSDLGIRFDLYYIDQKSSDWDTGEWLVKEGKRHK
ncbi:hypothetical protein ACQKP0_12285 [Heyndrickxia sp. NPDC080065]|uniref:hypothetical protein n=1 Tax=Heyndrickxia sp. NPDC080065 TaxID=3390568 RepID=UPI003D073C3B